MSKRKEPPTRRLLVFAIGFVVVFGIGAGLAKSMGWIGGGNEGREVETAEAKLKTITQIVSAPGKIQPEVEVIIFSEVSGEIINLEVNKGDYVQEGDLLVRIKPDIYQAQIEEIKVSLLMQKARMEQARATLLKAESEFNRQKQLYDKGVSSESEYIPVKTNFETGVSDNTHIQILSGINEGEEIVTGSYRTLSRDLKDGDNVTVNNNMFSQITAGE